MVGFAAPIPDGLVILGSEDARSCLDFACLERGVGSESWRKESGASARAAVKEQTPYCDRSHLITVSGTIDLFLSLKPHLRNQNLQPILSTLRLPKGFNDIVMLGLWFASTWHT